MSNRLALAPVPPVNAVSNCWNRIGVRGDASCPELRTRTHCRNCPVYADAARHLLDVEAPAGYVAEWTRHFATPSVALERDTESVVVFRLGAEWLGLPTRVVKEVAGVRPIHSLPHRRGAAVEGVTSVQGELLVCISLAHVLGVKGAGAPDQNDRRAVHQRFLVTRRGEMRIVFRVDEVHGIHRFHQRELKEVPATVARATVTYSRNLLPWNGHSVGILDDELLFSSLKRSLA